ncbi:hypothetical protein ACH5RR_015402 [Cinchona calisaya]|uniref:Uncharacterized protein n=1 Tax=Cinchona calisaya TaxID=153742 RepID=A0ABD2ZTG4_9GENT
MRKVWSNGLGEAEELGRTVEALLVCDFAVLEVISDIKPWKQQHSSDAHLQVIKQHGRTFSKLPARSCCASLRKPMKEMPAGWYSLGFWSSVEGSRESLWIAGEGVIDLIENY